MNNLRKTADQFSIGVSLVCAIHCLMLPMLLALVPSLGMLHLDSEAFHWIVLAAIPTSVYALTKGVGQHQQYHILGLGIIGLGLLILALLVGDNLSLFNGEKLLTVLGTALVSISHVWNLKCCHNNSRCATDQQCTCALASKPSDTTLEH
mgnify:CR=1 FL=1